MAQVCLNHWQCASGNLPAYCVVCGCEDDIEYLDREMEYRPTWPVTFLGFHFIGWHLIGGILGFFSERYNRVLLTRLPYCSDHYDYWEKLDRRQHLGVLILALGWLIPFIVTFIQNNNMRLSSNALMVAITATVVGFVVIYSYGFKIIDVAGVKDTRVLLAHVHPDFADAVGPPPIPDRREE